MPVGFAKVGQLHPSFAKASGKYPEHSPRLLWIVVRLAIKNGEWKSWGAEVRRTRLHQNLNLPLMEADHSKLPPIAKPNIKQTLAGLVKSGRGEAGAGRLTSP